MGFFCFSLQLSERARERKVPVTRIGRLANFGGEVATFPVLPLPYCPALFVLVERRWPLYIKVEVVGNQAMCQYWGACGSIAMN